jgi:hypothetical protein
MSKLFDIQPAIDAFIEAGDAVRVKALAPGTSRFDAADSNGIFAGDVPAGASLTGAGSLLVDGSLRGSPGNACLVEAGASVLITGDVRETRIAGASVHVCGGIRNGQAEATGHVIVGGDLAHAQIKIGGFERRKHRMDQLHHEIDRIQEQCASLDRNISQDERKLDRASKSTRVPLSFNVSTLIVQEPQRIRVNLNAFYISIGEQPAGTSRRALNEFFAKGIIGYLARTNRKYIIDNPAREKIFMQLLKNLRQLVMRVFERDQIMFRIQGAQQEVNDIVNGLEKQQPRIHVAGAVTPETTFEIIIPRVTHLATGDVSVVHQSARLAVKQGSRPGVFRVETKDQNGGTSASYVPAAEFRGVSLLFQDGEVIWRTRD